MKKTTNELAEDIKMTIAALLVMDGVTPEETTTMANKMLHDLDIDDQPAGLVIAKNSIALDHVAPIVDRYNHDMKVKEEIDTIINGIKTKEEDEDEVKTTDEEEGTTMTKKVYMGTLNRELQKLNDQLAEDYGNRYVTIHDGATYDDIVACEVSWASISPVTPEEATQFAGQLMTAIAMAKSFIFNGWEITYNKDEDEGETQAARERAKTILDNWDGAEEDPYYLLKYCDYDELTDEQKAMIDEYDARHEELAAAPLEDDEEDEYADEWALSPEWADYDTIDKIAMMMMDDGNSPWQIRNMAEVLQANYDGAVDAAVMLKTVPPRSLLTLMRNGAALREAARIVELHDYITPMPY